MLPYHDVVKRNKWRACREEEPYLLLLTPFAPADAADATALPAVASVASVAHAFYKFV